MVRVAWVTLRRLLKDRTILIALLFVPLVIILGFAFITQPAAQVQPIKVAIVGEVPAVYKAAVAQNFSVFKAANELKAVTLIQSGRVAGAFVFSEGALVAVKVSKQEVGGILVDKLETVKEDLPVVDPLRALKQRREGLIDFLINYMLFSLIAIATDLTSLKENRVALRLTAMPLRTVDVFGGHVLAFTVLLLMQVTLVYVAMYAVLGIVMVDVLPLGLLVMFGMILLTLSLGLLVARFSRQLSHVPMIANAVLVPFMMVSGTFMQLDGLGWLGRVKYYTPQFWVSDALKLINAGDLGVSMHVMVLMAMAMLVFSVSVVGRKAV